MSDTWSTSWAASTSGAAGLFAGPQATIRQSMRLSIGGDALRLRFANPHGYAPMVLDAVTVGRRAAGAGVEGADAVEGAAASVLVRGRRRIVVQPGECVVSDAVAVAVRDLDTVVVSVFVSAAVEMSGHGEANRHTWSTLVGTGDHTAEVAGEVFRPFGTRWLWVDAIEVRGADAGGTLVAIGDSITDGAGSDFGSDTRWTDVLAERFAALPVGDSRRRAVANAGIGGNTLAGVGDRATGVNVIARLERDALSLAGVSDVLVFSGSNDLHVGGATEDLVAAYVVVRERIHARGLRALIATMVPRVGGYLWTDECEAERLSANRWIRAQSGFDAVLDFDAALEDPAHRGTVRPEWNADGTHPNSEGYRALAASIDLEVFRDPRPS